MLGSSYLEGYILMTHLPSFDPNISSDPAILNPVTQENISVMTLLAQRVKLVPCLKIFSYLGGRDLLQLRLVSKLTAEDHAVLKTLISQSVKFRVDLSDACIAAMPTSYLLFGWRSMLFQRDLDYPQLLASLRFVSNFVVHQGVTIEDLTIDLSHLFPDAPVLDDELDFESDDELDEMIVDVEDDSMVVDTEEESMHDLFAPFFQQNLNSLQVRTSNQESSEFLTDLLRNCPSLKTLDLSTQNDFVTWIEQMNAEDCHRIFHSVEKLDLSYRRSTMFDETLPSHVLKTVLKSCTSLKSLVLEGCRSISRVISELSGDEINQIFGQLNELYLSGTNITSEALVSILSSNPPLRHLSLAGCRDLPEFSSNEPVLKDLEFLDLIGVSTEGNQLCSLLASCQNLKELFLAGCYDSLKMISSFTPEQLKTIFGQVRVLSLTGTNIDENGLKALLLSCESLNYLDLGACEALPAVLASLTDEQLRLIFAHLWHLDLRQIPGEDPVQLCRLLAQIDQLQDFSIESSSWCVSLFENLNVGSLNVLLGEVICLSMDYTEISDEVHEKIQMALPKRKR